MARKSPEQVKCLTCEYCIIENKQGYCGKITKEARKPLEVKKLRECKMYDLAPMHCVEWRKDKI